MVNNASGQRMCHSAEFLRSQRRRRDSHAQDKKIMVFGIRPQSGMLVCVLGKSHCSLYLLSNDTLLRLLLPCTILPWRKVFIQKNMYILDKSVPRFIRRKLLSDLDVLTKRRIGRRVRSLNALCPTNRARPSDSGYV